MGIRYNEQWKRPKPEKAPDPVVEKAPEPEPKPVKKTKATRKNPYA